MNIQPVSRFLRKLKAYNDREWFEKNKAEYREVHAIFLELTQILIDRVGKWDPEIAFLEPKKCVYRIYRDVRFSKDKTPYKTHLGAEITPGGRKSGLAGYYFHVSSKGIMVAGGVWRPSPENLAQIRQEIDYNPESFLNIVESSNFKKSFNALHGDKLKKAPKGYDPENPMIEYLKFKDFLAYQEWTSKEINGKNVVNVLVGGFKKLEPLNRFLNEAVD